MPTPEETPLGVLPNFEIKVEGNMPQTETHSTSDADITDKIPNSTEPDRSDKTEKVASTTVDGDVLKKQLAAQTNSARENASRFTEVAEILLSSPDKEGVLKILEEKPHLAKEIQRRFPDQYKQLSNQESEPSVQTKSAFETIASTAENTLNMERLLDAKMFQRDNNLADDEFGEVKVLAESLLQVNPSITWSKALETSMRTIKPSGNTSNKSPLSIPRNESTSDNAEDGRNKYMNMGFHESVAAKAVRAEKSGVHLGVEYGDVVIKI